MINCHVFLILTLTCQTRPVRTNRTGMRHLSSIQCVLTRVTTPYVMVFFHAHVDHHGKTPSFLHRGLRGTFLTVL